LAESSVAYRWQRWVDSDSDGEFDAGESAEIPGVMTATYQLTQGDVGARIRSLMTAIDGAPQYQGFSAWSPVITGGSSFFKVNPKGSYIADLTSTNPSDPQTRQPKCC
jgi:hypothetical protein